jgi:hypothetical protein
LLKLMSRNITVRLGVESLKGGSAIGALPLSSNIGFKSFLALRQ